MGGVLPYGQEEADARPNRPSAGQGPRTPPIRAATTLTPGDSWEGQVREIDSSYCTVTNRNSSANGTPDVGGVSIKASRMTNHAAIAPERFGSSGPIE